MNVESALENSNPPGIQRRYDIDWLRVIAIAILLVFHIMIMFQSYANSIFFIKSPALLEILLIPLSLFSVMRIPLLFFVSGMGTAFSLRKRTCWQFLGERALRILVPLVFGAFAIVPIHYYLYAKYYGEDYSYVPDVGHLWFLLNIFIYILWYFALIYFSKEVQNWSYLKKLGNLIAKYPIAIYLLAIPYVLEALTIPSDMPYSLFYAPSVGYLLGAIAFLLGFTFILIGEPVWKALSGTKYLSLLLAITLYIIRITAFEIRPPHMYTALESISWIFAILGLGYTYLNKPGKVLQYLSRAAYPFYIVHMVFMYLGAYYVFPLELNPWLSLVLIILVTFAGCWLTFEMVKRIIFLRPLFGLKIK